MKNKAGSLVHPSNLIAYENGSKFHQWAFHTTNSAGWSAPNNPNSPGSPPMADYQNAVMGFNNNAGTGIGLAMFKLDASVFNLADAGGYDDAHTVHLRVTHGNSTGTDVYCLGVATACHDSPAVNGYAVGLTHDGVPRITLAKVASGVVTPLLLIQKEVFAGDVISISYRWDSGSSIAELAMMHNGTPLEFQPGDFTTLDAGGYEIGAVANGRFGMFGNSSRSIQTGGAVVPEVAYEWWVTAGWVSFAEPPSLSQTTSGIRLAIMERQQFSNDPDPVIRKLVSGSLISCSWSHQRIGGNKDLSARFRFSDVSGAEHVDAKSFIDPTYQDWNTSDWLGGEVVLEYHYFDDALDETQDSGVIFRRDSVWRGRLSEIKTDPEGVIQMRAEGLSSDLDTLFHSRVYENETIRNIVMDIVSSVAKGGSFTGTDTYLRYNPDKIVGINSVMDVKIDADFQWESARSAIQRVLEFLPPDFVWGVDRHGEFYLVQEADYYTEAQAGAGIQHFEVDDDAVKFDRQTDFTRIRTSYVVLGDEIEDPRVNVNRVQGFAVCNRARELFGLRGVVQQESDISDTGTAAKLAATQLKALTSPLITGRLTVSRPVHEERELWQTLTQGAPKMAITDRRSRVSLSSATSAMGVDDHITTEYTTRMFGDSTAYSCNEKGSAGGNILLASVAREQVLNTDWLFHIVVENTYLHPGVSGDSAFIFGRPSSSASDEGWGSLWWKHDGGSNGHLEWRYETDGGTSRVIDTGITLAPDGLGNKVVNFTIHRDNTGVFRCYDGNTLTDTESGFTGDTLQNATHSWRAFQHGNGSLPATQIDGDCSIDQMWLIDTTLVKALDGGIPGLISSANTLPLPRGRGLGLIRYFPMQEPAGAATRTLASWLDAGAGTIITADGTWSRSEASGTGDGAKLSNGARGLLLGKEKKWGGPLIFSAESADYELDGSTGILTRQYVLGELPPDLITNVAVLNQEIRRLNESLRRA